MRQNLLSTCHSNCNRYDALTVSNKVSYQNALTEENLTFATACGGILTNYCWKEKDTMSSRHEALQKKLPLQHVYFGIDVWAQNATKLSQPRITYPEYGGGGTNTGVAVAKLAELGLSAGVFAPAWTFEHFPRYGRALEQTVWDGGNLPVDVACSCGDCHKRHRPNRAMSVTSFAKLYNASSNMFFFTDFTRAFGTHGDKEKDGLFNGHMLHAQLGSQSILPLRTESLGLQCSMRHRIEDAIGRSQLIVERCSMSTAPTRIDMAATSNKQLMPLFKLNMPADGSLRLRISYRDLTETPKGMCFYMKISGTIHSLVQSDKTRTDHLIDVEIKASDTVARSSSRLEELGLHSETANDGTHTRLAEVDYICIQPVGSYPSRSHPNLSKRDVSQPRSLQYTLSDGSPRTHSIFNVHRKSRDGEATEYTRLCWSHTSSVRSVQGMPYSTVTGSFSYFAIYLDGMILGRAYAAEHELPSSFVEQSKGREVLVNIKGIGFDGQELASANVKIQL